MIGKIFKAGNSNAVVIPRPMLLELGIKTGQEMVIERVPDTEAILVAPVKKRTAGSVVSAEFKKWLANFIHEDALLLDELAQR